MNYIIFFANILDPTNKLEYLEFSLSQIYRSDFSGSLFSLVKFCLFELFKDYNVMYAPVVTSCESQS